MTDTTASFDDVVFFSGRDSTYSEIRAGFRSLIASATTGIAAVAAVGATAGVATVAGVWMVGIALSGNAHLHARTPMGPAGLALTDMAAFPQDNFEAKWASAGALMPAAARAAMARRLASEATPIEQVAAAPHPIARKIARMPIARPRVANAAPAAVKDLAAGRTADLTWGFSVPKAGVLVAPQETHEAAASSNWVGKRNPADAEKKVAALTPPATPMAAPLSIAPELAQPARAPKPAAQAIAIPLPLRRPAGIVTARAPANPEVFPAEKPLTVAPKLASLTPADKPHAKKVPVLPWPDSRTALYDISGHTVYMPDGTRLEAHSGLGSKIDNPRFIRVRMRGPTPPNVYDLTLRKQLFHGVRAIRLNPVNENKMFGRDGMLAHTYMLGPNGQSNGCVSFKHYQRFLQAFLDGKIDRMVVVGNLDEAPAHLASLVRADRPRSMFRYVAANERSPLNY